MVRYELVGTDLAGVRFAISPLNEVVLSLRGWRDPGRYPLHLPWLAATRAARAGLDRAMLLALTNDNLYTPDFLTPRPRSPLTRIEDEFRLIARTSSAVLSRDLRAVHARGPLPGALRGDDAAVLGRMVAALKAYWRACFVPYWPRMRTVLESDVTYRGREVAQHGLAVMFGGLARSVRLVDNVVQVRLRADVDYRAPATSGLTLVPTMWTSEASAPISPEASPVIMYVARGVGTLWQAGPLPAPGALTGLVGAVRAGLLVRLAVPASSTELAVGLGVSPAAVNQHLRALRDGGLLVSARHGRSVLYRRSELGDQLVERTGGVPG